MSSAAIACQEDSQLIQNSRAVHVQPERLDFGQVELGATGVREFLLVNEAASSVHIERILVESDAFAVGSTGDFEVGPQSSRSVSVEFRPLTPIEYTTIIGLFARNAPPCVWS